MSLGLNDLASEQEDLWNDHGLLFYADGLLITTGGAGTSSWRWTFNELYGIPADIGKATKAG